MHASILEKPTLRTTFSAFTIFWFGIKILLKWYFSKYLLKIKKKNFSGSIFAILFGRTLHFKDVLLNLTSIKVFPQNVEPETFFFEIFGDYLEKYHFRRNILTPHYSKSNSMKKCCCFFNNLCLGWHFWALAFLYSKFKFYDTFSVKTVLLQQNWLVVSTFSSFPRPTSRYFL